jgi:hypothetical protein
MLLTKVVIMKWNPKNRKYYEEKGYIFTKWKDEFEIKIEDLAHGSDIITVDVECDYCHKKFQKIYMKYYKEHFTANLLKDCCMNCRDIKREECNLIKYGVKYVAQLGKVQEKRKQTNLEKYGETSYTKTQEYKTRVVDTNMKKYGKPYVTQVEEFKEKTKQTNLKNCGKEYHMQTDEFWGKTRKTLLKEYGVEHISQSSEIKEKIKETCNQKFGTNYPLQSKEIQDKAKVTCLEKYGAENYSQSEENRNNYLGKGNPNWKGGITPINKVIRYSQEYLDWRITVLEKDNYTCQCCGDSKGHNLHVHHIKNFSNNEDLRFDINNGITLCEKCHDSRYPGSFHNIYGTRNNDENQLQEYINNYQKSNSLAV